MVFNFTLYFLGAFGLTYLIIPVLQRLAKAKNLFDLPDHRKKHETPTPSLGGLALFMSFLVMALIAPEINQLPQSNFILLAVFILLIVGVYDDLVEIRALHKAAFQMLVASILFFAGFRIEGMIGGLDIGQIPLIASYGITVFFLMLIINAYNLIDGIDGLAGSLGLHATIVFAWLFHSAGLAGWSLIAIIMSASILGFLRYNFNRATIFMGDSGSMFIGLMIGVFSLKYLQCCGPQTAGTYNVLIIMSIVIIPVLDLLRVFSMRILGGHSPFAADRTHIHHILLNNGLHTTSICISLILFNLLLVLSATWLRQVFLPLAIMELLLSTIIGFLILSISSFIIRSKKSKKQNVEKSIINESSPN